MLGCVWQYKARVGENKADVLVLRIPVEDKDLKGTANWKVIFKITKGNENGYFRVDTDPETNEGLLYVTKVRHTHTHTHTHTPITSG